MVLHGRSCGIHGIERTLIVQADGREIWQQNGRVGGRKAEQKGDGKRRGEGCQSRNQAGHRWRLQRHGCRIAQRRDAEHGAPPARPGLRDVWGPRSWPTIRNVACRRTSAASNRFEGPALLLLPMCASIPAAHSLLQAEFEAGHRLFLHPLVHLFQAFRPRLPRGSCFARFLFARSC